jgi:hypothetical protein
VVNGTSFNFCKNKNEQNIELIFFRHKTLVYHRKIKDSKNILSTLNVLNYKYFFSQIEGG